MSDRVAHPSSHIPPWDGTPQQVGECWTLRRRHWVAACHLWTHPLGAELKLTFDGRCVRSTPWGTARELVGLAEKWRMELEGIGWR